MDVAYCTDHNYMFYCCVSIRSLMEHVPSGERVRLHLLVNETFCDEDEELLCFLQRSLPDLEVIVHRIDEALFAERNFTTSQWSKVIFYRMLLPELLRDVDLCLYLDSDTLVVDDLTPLFRISMEEYYLAGVFENISAARAQSVGSAIPIDTYVNSGVLLMNLERMRKDSVQEKLLRADMNSIAPDQDILNICCYGGIRLLPAEYNYIPGTAPDCVKIFHFLMRDYIRPWKNLRAYGARQWWEVAETFAGVYDVASLRQKADWYERGSLASIFCRCAGYQEIYVVGSGDDARRLHRALRLGKCRALKSLAGEENPIPYSEGSLLIVTSRRLDIPALREYEEHPGGGNQILRYVRWPVSWYNVSVSKDLNRELAAELLMWEYGVDARGMFTPGALLELNAVRCPQKEALVEYHKGERLCVSFAQLNERVNRMAAYIGQRNIRRGTRIALRRDAGSGVDFLVAALGIMKAGCVPDLAGSPGSAREEGMAAKAGSAGDADSVGMEGLLPAGDADLVGIKDLSREEGLFAPAPFPAALPDEPALFEGGETLTGRALVKLSEELRRRSGWHGQDKLLLVPGGSCGGLVELLAAFAAGGVTCLLLGEDAELFTDILRKEKITLASLPEEAFVRVITAPEGAAGKPAGEIPSGLRLLLTDGKQSREMSLARAKWSKKVPHVPVNGIGYEGGFRYGGQWY